MPMDEWVVPALAGVTALLNLVTAIRNSARRDKAAEAFRLAARDNSKALETLSGHFSRTQDELAEVLTTLRRLLGD